MTKQLPSVEMLHKLLRADFDDGKLYWRERTPDMFEKGRWSAEATCKCWNNRFAGKEAFTSDNGKGYLVGAIFNRLYRAHRVIWAMHTGAWPVEHVDHINGDSLDNRIENLRAVSQAQNSWNSKTRSNNTSGYKGVSWDKKYSKWGSTINKYNKHYFLGYFDCPEKAHQAYCKAAKKMHGEYANTGVSS